MKANEETIEQLLLARKEGLTLRQAAACAGVHVATVCRWQNRNPELRQALWEAQRTARRLRMAWGPRPAVEWRRDCPECGADVVVRTAPGKFHFWRCEDWPWCRWASWRPPAPGNCPECKGLSWYWSHSRKSMGCDECGMRICVHSLRQAFGKILGRNLPLD
jgi:hypothetical protein